MRGMVCGIARWLPGVLILASAFCAVPADAKGGFEEVASIFEQHCFKCHSHASGKSKGGLLLDSHAAILQGGESGPALSAGDPAQSLLLERILSTDPEKQMPPKGERVSAAELQVLTEWIRSDASNPTASKGAARPPGRITDEDRKWWAFQPVSTPAIPPALNARDFANPIDRFIDARLAKEGLDAAPEAERHVLIRRVTFDLTGLPPTPEEVDAFVGDSTPDAYANLVNRLLESPRYGERMARLWLDLVRYADSDGYRIDDYRPTAWRYRDYVIRAFNSGKPYSRFVQEQLAGDEMFPDDPEALTATGYLRHWIYEYNNSDARGQWDTILNDITDTTSDVFLGLGLQCARCHDHKFDPILQRDYYALQSFFSGILPRQDQPAATQAERSDHAAALAEWENAAASTLKQIAAIEVPFKEKARLAAIKRFPEDVQAMLEKPVTERTPYEHQVATLAFEQVRYDWNRLDRDIKGEASEKLSDLKKRLETLSRKKPASLPEIMSVSDVGRVAPLARIPKKGVDVEPAFLSVLSSELPAPGAVITPPANVESTGRRSALARWLTAPENPLTSRVIVNRVWQMHFHQGLAAFPSDFGKLGEPPSHPELLDWLSGWFVREGWDFRKLHRLILTSAAYKRSSKHPNPAPGALVDPTSRLLWRALPHRLDAEQIRDAMLAVSGELKLADSAIGGPGGGAMDARRSIYTRVMRNSRDVVLDAFDAPYWFSSAASRDVTTTPVQSLLMINGPFVLARGRAFAERVLYEASQDKKPLALVQTAYRLAFARSPSPHEERAAMEFIYAQEGLESAAGLQGDGAASLKIGSDSRLAGLKRAPISQFAADKIPFRDGQATHVSPSEGPLFVAGLENMEVSHGLTVEAFILPRSVSDAAALRVIAAQWTGNSSDPGWSFGITGMRSRRTPMVLAFHGYGPKKDGSFGEFAVFSNLKLQMNKPYYVAASVRLAQGDQLGSVEFSMKDLSNDDEPLLHDSVELALAHLPAGKEPFTIGGRGVSGGGLFDGAIDDVRLSSAPLTADKLLIQREDVNESTVGYWRFEPRPGALFDSGPGGHHLMMPLQKNAASRIVASKERSAAHEHAVAHPINSANSTAAQKAALAAFCQSLLNASEFLYTE